MHQTPKQLPVRTNGGQDCPLCADVAIVEVRKRVPGEIKYTDDLFEGCIRVALIFVEECLVTIAVSRQAVLDRARRGIIETHKVFLNNDGVHLNLVTCGGVWDTVRKIYRERLVIFTDAVEVQP